MTLDVAQALVGVSRDSFVGNLNAQTTFRKTIQSVLGDKVEFSNIIITRVVDTTSMSRKLIDAKRNLAIQSCTVKYSISYINEFVLQVIPASEQASMSAETLASYVSTTIVAAVSPGTFGKKFTELAGSDSGIKAISIVAPPQVAVAQSTVVYQSTTPSPTGHPSGAPSPHPSPQPTPAPSAISPVSISGIVVAAVGVAVLLIVVVCVYRYHEIRALWFDFLGQKLEAKFERRALKRAKVVEESQNMEQPPLDRSSRGEPSKSYADKDAMDESKWEGGSLPENQLSLELIYGDPFNTLVAETRRPQSAANLRDRGESLRQQLGLLTGQRKLGELTPREMRQVGSPPSKIDNKLDPRLLLIHGSLPQSPSPPSFGPEVSSRIRGTQTMLLNTQSANSSVLSRSRSKQATSPSLSRPVISEKNSVPPMTSRNRSHQRLETKGHTGAISVGHVAIDIANEIDPRLLLIHGPSPEIVRANVNKVNRIRGVQRDRLNAPNQQQQRLGEVLSADAFSWKRVAHDEWVHSTGRESRTDPRFDLL